MFIDFSFLHTINKRYSKHGSHDIFIRGVKQIGTRFVRYLRYRSISVLYGGSVDPNCAKKKLENLGKEMSNFTVDRIDGITNFTFPPNGVPFC
jgi:hypothetical protein